MNPIVILLLAAAFERYGTQISYPIGKRSWTESVTYEPCMSAYYLWFNTPDHSTHVVKLNYTIKEHTNNSQRTLNAKYTTL